MLLSLRDWRAEAMKVEKLTSRIGARVSDIDITQPLDDAAVAAIRQALLDNCVLFFTGQKLLEPEQYLRFGNYFGPVEIPEFQTRATVVPEVMILDQTDPKGQGSDSWHADNTYLEAPPMGTSLQACQLPPVGGDTLFANMHEAYEALSPAMQDFFSGLTAKHGTARLIERTRSKALYKLPDSLVNREPISHPIIAVHPETGRRLLFVNNNWSLSIDGLTKAESDHWLKFLLDHVKSPEFQVRHRWSVGDVAFWDNRCTQHYAVADYTERRLMQRIVISGTRPLGIGDAQSAREAVAA
jgi:taurine dioxygenase